MVHRQLRQPANEPPDGRRGSGRSRVGAGARAHRVSEPRVPGCESVPRDRRRLPRRAREDSYRCRFSRPRDLDEQYVRLPRSISCDRARTPRGSRDGGLDARDRGDDLGSLVESFRRTDWIDVSLRLRRFGLPRTFIATVVTTWPSAGFHRRLVQLTIDRFWKHPLTPLPMVKW
jgi:hypothetical protein